MIIAKLNIILIKLVIKLVIKFVIKLIKFIWNLINAIKLFLLVAFK